MDGEEIDRQRLPRAVRFSLPMHELNHGVLILFRWPTLGCGDSRVVWRAAGVLPCGRVMCRPVDEINNAIGDVLAGRVTAVGASGGNRRPGGNS
jgi:hypothetical protein